MSSKLIPGLYLLFWLGTQQRVEVRTDCTGATVFVTESGMEHPIEDAAGAEFYKL